MHVQRPYTVGLDYSAVSKNKLQIILLILVRLLYRLVSIPDLHIYCT